MTGTQHPEGWRSEAVAVCDWHLMHDSPKRQCTDAAWREEMDLRINALRRAMLSASPAPQREVTPPSKSRPGLREEIARIIAPKQWRESDDRNDSRGHPVMLAAIDEVKLGPSLAKANAILKLFGGPSS